MMASLDRFTFRWKRIHSHVIASEAKQSSSFFEASGLLRRGAPRNDDNFASV